MNTIRLFLAVAALFMAAVPASAQKRANHEFYKDFPVYADMLQAQLTYPMAWGNSKTRNFAKWKRQAREKVQECMMTPPPAPESYDMTVLGEERRDGYVARKIEFNLSAFYRVRAYVLIPDGDGPFPAINLLHDHGAHLFIGKEKMIRPFGEDSTVIKDADEWQPKVYGGQYMGDYLARQGYLVFSTDAPMWGERGRAEGVDRNKYDIIAGNMMMYGRDLSAFMTYDDIALYYHSDGTCLYRVSRHAARSGQRAHRLRRLLNGGLPCVDALGAVRQDKGRCGRVLDGYDRRSDDVEVRTEGKRRLRQLHTCVASVSRLSPHCESGLSQAYAFHQRPYRQTLPHAGRREGFLYHARRVGQPESRQQSCHRDMGNGT